MNAHQEVATRDAEPVDMMAMIYRLATDEAVNAEKLEALLSMKERIDATARAIRKEDEAEAARKAYDDALAAAQAEMPIVLKEQYNSQTRSSYSDLASVLKVAAPIIAKHGFSLSFSPARSDKADHFGIRYRISHCAGHCVEDVADIPSPAKGPKGNDFMTNVHAFGSGMSYGRRYITCMVFNIATGDDTDGSLAQPQQRDEPQGPDHNRISPFLQRIARATQPGDGGDLQVVWNDAKRILRGEDYAAVKAAVLRKKDDLEASND